MNDRYEEKARAILAGRYEEGSAPGCRRWLRDNDEELLAQEIAQALREERDRCISIVERVDESGAVAQQLRHATR